MLVNRVEFPVKPGNTSEARVLLEEEMKRFNPPHAIRIYTIYIGRINTLALECEFESLDELDRFWTKWLSDPEADKFKEKHEPLVEHGIVSEVWWLSE